MTITISYADTTDGTVTSHNASYATALAGSGLSAATASGNLTFGQALSGAFIGEYSIDQAFLSFTYTVPANENMTEAHIDMSLSQVSANAATARTLEMREFDWGASLTTADFRTPGQLGALPLLCSMETAEDSDVPLGSGGDALVARLVSASPLRIIVVTNKNTASTTPSNDERIHFYSADSSGTSVDPHLVINSVRNSELYGPLGAQAQLSDGTHVFVEATVAPTFSPSINLYYHNGTSASLVSDLTNQVDSLGDFGGAYTQHGSQNWAIAVDSSDNIYVVTNTASNTLAGVGYTKGVGKTWTPAALITASMPSYPDGSINNVACAWHSVGTSGTIMCIVGHAAGRTPNVTGDTSYALLNCQSLLAGSGSLLRTSGTANSTLIESDIGAFWHYRNATGTVLDVCAAPSTTNRGYVISSYKSDATTLTEDQFLPSVYRYVLASDGASLSDTDVVSWTFLPDYYVAKDASSKIRVLGVDGTVFAFIVADDDPTYGLCYMVMQNTGTSSSFNLLGTDTLDSLGLASMPAASVIGHTQKWDAVYDSVGKKLYVYYLHTSDSRRLFRTGIDMNTYLMDATEVEVNAAVGAVGSTNYAIRTHRNTTNGQQILISVANVSSGGTHDTLYITDSLNVAPTAPTLTTKSNFDATAAATFNWTFNDPNPSDTQSAFQMQVNTSGGVFEYDSAKVSASAATYIGAGAFATGNNASVVPALPGSIADGDTLLCYATIRNSGTGTVGTAPAGWQTLLAFGNVAFLGKVYATGDAAPTVTFSGGVANADTTAQIAAFRNLPLNVVASATQLNGSAQNVAYPALTVPNNASVVIVAGWKQDDSTGYATLAGMTEIAETNPTAGDDASAAWDYLIQTTAANVSASSFTVSGGASAISRGVVLSLGPAGNTATASSMSLVANTLPNAGSWQWRVRTYDAAGLVSPWSSFGTFSTAAGGNVTITSPATDNPGGQITDNYTIVWNATGTTQAYYRVKVVRTSDSSTLSDTGFVASVATSADISGLLSGVEYRVEVTVRNAGLVDSGTGTRLITPDYGAPDTPTMMLTAPTNLGYILVTIDNPTPTGDRPTPSSNLILRRIANSGDDYVAVGSTTNDGTYKDYAVASGVTYEYVVRAVAA